MKAFVNFQHKVAYIQTDDVEQACSWGKDAVRSYQDTFNFEGWVLWCTPTSRDMRRDDRQEANVVSIDELIELIHRGPSPQTSSFVGPFGEGSNA